MNYEQLIFDPITGCFHYILGLYIPFCLLLDWGRTVLFPKTD